MFAQFAQGGRRGTAPAAFGQLFGQHFNGAVHADGEDLLLVRQVGVDLVPFDVRPIAPEVRLDWLTVFGMGADVTGQGQKLKGLVIVDGIGGPAFGQAGAFGFLVFVRRFAQLNIRPEAPGFQPDLQPGFRLHAQHAFVALLLPLQARRAEGAGIAAFGIVRAADEGPPGSRRAHRQAARLAFRTQARIGAVALVGEDMRLQHFVYLLEDFGDPKLRCLADGRRKVAPETGQNVLVVLVAGGNLVQFLLQPGSEVIADVAPEVIRQEDRHQPSLIFGEQAVAFLAGISAVDDGRQDAGIGRRAPDAQFFHLLDQRRLGVARRRLGEALLTQNRVRGGLDQLVLGRLIGIGGDFLGRIAFVYRG